MNTTDLDDILRKELNGEISLPTELDSLVQQKMQVIVQKKSRHRLLVPLVASLILAALEMFIAISFIHSVELKIITAAMLIALPSIFTFYAIISSTDKIIIRKELHYA